jgi:pimeloyl-ACP methyl ester carboxylesterase
VSHLTVRVGTPDWFDWAIAQPKESRTVDVDGCAIHYLLWESETPARGGLLLLHGGGAHANWWSFIAPFLARDHRVAAIDLSGMGDSGRRETYDSDIRAAEMRAVIADAGLAGGCTVIGHSFGGFMTMKFGALFGDEIDGAIIADTPVFSPDEEHPPFRRRAAMTETRIYPDFEAALARFRLMPQQSCDNDFLVEFIGRHSLRPIEGGWTWKFDAGAMGARRFGEPFHEYLQALQCRSALIFGENSKLVSRDRASYIASLMGPKAPIIELPRAQHHLQLDQPLAFVAAVRALLEVWGRG